MCNMCSLCGCYSFLNIDAPWKKSGLQVCAYYVSENLTPILESYDIQLCTISW